MHDILSKFTYLPVLRVKIFHVEMIWSRGFD